MGHPTEQQQSKTVREQTTVWVEDHWMDLAIGVPAVLVAMVLVEISKGWVKLWLAERFGKRFRGAVEKNVARTLLLPASIVPVFAFEFTMRFNRMFSTDLDFFSGALIGIVLNAGLAIGTHHVIRRIDVVNLARTALQKRLGVTDEDVENAKED